MRCYHEIILSFALRCGLLVAVVVSETALAAAPSSDSSFSQLVLSFPTEKKFSYDFSRDDNSLHFSFPGTTANELEALNNYDESLVRRVFIKEVGSRGTEVRLVLRDPNVEALVSTFSEPYRIVIDLFDKNFREPKDPVTGLPVSVSSSVSESDAGAEAQIVPVMMATSKNQVNPNPVGPKKRLLQQLAPVAESPNQLSSLISGIDPGLGKAWSSFPPYVYRMQLAPLPNEKTASSEVNQLQSKALSTSSAMADYASKLFDLGHESRALAAYQQVLQREPEIFEKDALHLWKLAESQLGAGNLTLAEGYYQTLIEKHPDHIMARYARLRKLDVQAIRAAASGESARFAELRERALALPTRESADLLAMIAIRSSWWSDPTVDQKSRTALASCSEETEAVIKKILPRIDNPKTAYLASAMIAKRMTSSDTNWQNDYAPWLGSFFNRYRNTEAHITEPLSQATRRRLTEQFRSLYDANQHAEVVALYDQLPKEMKSIAKDPQVSWIIADSFRPLGQTDQALDFYVRAAQSSDPVDRFKSNFWIAKFSAKKASELKKSRATQNKVQAAKNQSAKSDREMEKLWSKLSADDRNKLMTALNGEFRDVAASDANLRTPAIVVLDQYKSALSDNPPKLDATPGTGRTDWLGSFSPSSATVKLLDDLGRKFADLGMPKEHREALQLMRFIKPNQLEQDKVAAKVWATQMTKLAEEHRKADEFLEAGEIYTQIGDVTALGESRAESLYKGGLLLFRAGKKNDAIKALEKAKSDPNNLFYSNLATERLNQIGKD